MALTTIESAKVTIPPGGNSYTADPNSMRVQCPSGYYVVGTGIDTGIGNMDFILSFKTLVGGFVHNDTSINIQAAVQAICAQLPAGASISANQRKHELREFDQKAGAYAKAHARR